MSRPATNAEALVNRRQRCEERQNESSLQRRWTRSQSPLRQLLKAGTSSRPGSPQREPPTGLADGNSSGHDDLDASDGAIYTTTGSLPMMARSADRGNDDMVPEDDSSDTLHRPIQLERRCMKSVFHPISYDECHIPADEVNDNCLPAAAAASGTVGACTQKYTTAGLPGFEEENVRGDLSGHDENTATQPQT